jgi:glycosyltransferase involved in cell wall biosynthesis
VAEALALGTPVVCLDHGGPPELLTRWRTTPSAAVAIGSWEETAAALGAAICDLADAAHTIPSVRRPTRRYDEVILDAYAAVAADTTLR